MTPSVERFGSKKFPCVAVVFLRCDDKLQFIVRPQAGKIVFEHPIGFPAGLSLPIEDHDDLRGEIRDRKSAGCLEQNRLFRLDQTGKKARDGALDERFASGDRDEFGAGKRLRNDFADRHTFSTGEGVRAVAPRTAQRTAGGSNKERRQPHETGLPLKTRVEFRNQNRVVFLLHKGGIVKERPPERHCGGMANCGQGQISVDRPSWERRHLACKNGFVEDPTFRLPKRSFAHQWTDTIRQKMPIFGRVPRHLPWAGKKQNKFTMETGILRKALVKEVRAWKIRLFQTARR